MTAVAERAVLEPSTPRVLVVDPLADPRWDAFVDTHPSAGPFHHSSWAGVLVDAYSYEPRFRVLEMAGRIRAGWPAMLVRSRLTGTRLVTMPFSDYCPPLVGNNEDAALLHRSVVEDAHRLGASRIEVRGWPSNVALPGDLKPSAGYVRHLVDLSGGTESARSRLSENARRSLRKANDFGVTTRLADGRRDYDVFLALNLKLRRKHGMLPQPPTFFQAMWRRLIETERGYVLFAEHQGRVLAALLCLRRGGTTLDKFAVNDESLSRFRGSHAATWAVIEREIARGARTYDMGRTDARAEGLIRFKKQFGGVIEDATYFFDPSPAGPTTEDPTGLRKLALDTFARVAPDPIFKGAGRLVYRHLG